MGTRFRQILRDIWARKARTALVSISILIGVFGVVALISAGDILITQLKADIDESELPMARIYPSLPEGVVLDNEQVMATLQASQEEITQLEAQAVYPFSWRLPEDERFEGGYLFSYSKPLEEVELEPMRLLEEGDGRWPVDGAKEVVIERRMAEEYNLEVGDTLVFRILSRAEEAVQDDDSLQIPEEEWEIVGIVFHPYPYVTGGPEIESEQSIYTTFSNAQYIAGFKGYSSFFVRYPTYQVAEVMVPALEATIRQETPYRPVFTWKEAPSDNTRVKTSEQFTTVINILALIAVTVAGFLVANVISTMVTEQRNQIGVMKSLGATRLDTVIMYGGIAVSYGIIGMIPAVIAGIPAADWMAKQIAPFTNIYIEGFRTSTLGIVLGIAMGLGVPILASIIPIYNSTRVTILESITDLGISARYGSGPLARLIEGLPLPINIRQALANLTMKKVRLALTVIVMTLAVAAFMGISALFISINTTIQDIFDTFNFQAQVTPSEGQDFDAVRQLILDDMDDTIQEVYPAFGVAIRVEGYEDQFFGSDQLFALGFDPDTGNIAPEMQEGRMISSDPDAREVVITASLADNLDKQVGDDLEFTIGGREEAFKIVGIEGILPFDTAYFEWRTLARISGFTVGAPNPEDYVTSTSIDEHGTAMTVGLPEEAWPFLAGGPYDAENPGVILTPALADALDKAAGETVTLTTDASSTDYPIIAVLTNEQMDILAAQSPDEFSDIENLEVAIMFWQDLARLEGISLEGRPAANAMLIEMVNNDPTVEEVDVMIEELNELLLVNGITAQYENQVKTSEQVAEGILSIGVLFNITSGVMAAVGAIGLLTTLSMSVFERQKEIGVMRSVGATSVTVATQFLVEGVAVGVLAWLVGVPLSFLLANGIASVLPFGDVFNFSYPPIMLVVGLVGVVIIATIASLWPSIGAARKTVSNILRYQ